jgi:hypothetical protein
MYRKNVDMVNLTTGIMFLLFTCMHFWVREILRRWFASAPTAYEVVRDCSKFEKHWAITVGKVECGKRPHPKFDMTFHRHRLEGNQAYIIYLFE